MGVCGQAVRQGKRNHESLVSHTCLRTHAPTIPPTAYPTQMGVTFPKRVLDFGVRLGDNDASNQIEKLVARTELSAISDAPGHGRIAAAAAAAPSAAPIIGGKRTRPQVLATSVRLVVPIQWAAPNSVDFCFWL